MSASSSGKRSGITRLRRLSLALAVVGVVALLAGLLAGREEIWEPAAVTASVGLAVGIGAIAPLRGYGFTAWILAAVVCAMIYPARFLHVGALDLRSPWLILLVVQLVMFGMGTQMSLKDFAGVLRMPHSVLIGLACQFTIMPLVGYGLAEAFGFPPEIAAGVVLIGSCSSGLASNVMTYLAGANLALSITLTACATMMAPVITPFWMTRLAGELVEVDFLTMMMSIVRIVVAPVGAALLHDYLRFASKRGRRIVGVFIALAALYLVVLLSAGGPLAGNELATAIGFASGALVIGAAYHGATRLCGALEERMPLFSMLGIVYFTAVTTAAGRDQLLALGALLFLAAVVHNTAGYVLGYWAGRLCRLDRRSARTIALEVGLQNGGMAAGLAGAMGKLGTVGLAAAIFSPWMNVSGSVLANHWKRRPVTDASRQGEAGDDSPASLISTAEP